MENVLYSYHFNFIEHLFSLIPIVIGVVFLAYTFRKDNSKWKDEMMTDCKFSATKVEDNGTVRISYTSRGF